LALRIVSFAGEVESALFSRRRAARFLEYLSVTPVVAKRGAAQSRLAAGPNAALPAKG
jgi:hypothetical protein